MRRIVSKLQGGTNRFQLVPLRPDGRGIQREGPVEVIGNHRDDWEGLNVGNPQAGHVYQWGRNRPQSLRAAQIRKWTPVRDGDPEFPAYELADYESTDTPTKLDTTKTFGGLVLLRSTEENLARIHAKQSQESESQLRGSADGYLQGTTAEEQALTRTHEGNYLPARFARREHGITIREGDEIVDHFRAEKDFQE